MVADPAAAPYDQARSKTSDAVLVLSLRVVMKATEDAADATRQKAEATTRYMGRTRKAVDGSEKGERGESVGEREYDKKMAVARREQAAVWNHGTARDRARRALRSGPG